MNQNPKATNKVKPLFTEKQYVLFIYFLNNADIIRWKELENDSDKMRLIYMLLQKEPPKTIGDSKLYKFLLKVIRFGVIDAYGIMQSLRNDLFIVREALNKIYKYEIIKETILEIDDLIEKSRHFKDKRN